MKQGSGHSSNMGRKQEPVCHPVSPAAASQIGQALAYPGAPMNEGRGASAPQPAGVQVHKTGSQGKHGD